MNERYTEGEQERESERDREECVREKKGRREMLNERMIFRSMNKMLEENGFQRKKYKRKISNKGIKLVNCINLPCRINTFSFMDDYVTKFENRPCMLSLGHSYL